MPTVPAHHERTVSSYGDDKLLHKSGGTALSPANRLVAIIGLSNELFWELHRFLEMRICYERRGRCST